MVSRRRFLQYGLSAGLAAAASVTRGLAADPPPIDVTFLVINDVHACRMAGGENPACHAAGKTDDHLLRHIRGLNGIVRQRWPAEIGGRPSGLSCAGQGVGRPAGVVLCGDVTDDGGGQVAKAGEGPQILQFSQRYQEGRGPDRLHFPVYVGLGNHDLDQDGPPPLLERYRDEMRDYLRLNHQPSAFFKAPAPADNYDEDSDSYSWNWGGLHLVQVNRFAGDTRKNMASDLDWLRRDLKTYAADGRPVIVFQHYGWDDFSVERWDPARATFAPDGAGEAHWWSEAERRAMLDALAGYNVIGLFHGHEHDAALAYRVGSLDMFKARAAFLGGFCLVRVAGAVMDVAIGDVTGEDGGVTFLKAFSKPFVA